MTRSVPRRAHPTPEERFWAKVNKDGPVHPELGPCWVWMGERRRKGSGCFRIAGRSFVAARFSWQLHFGPVPEGLWVLHHCDNGGGSISCVNPTHLFLGTNEDNVADKVRKGRQSRGEGHGRAKLTDQDIRDIRARYRRDSRTDGSVAMAREYGIDHTVILDIVRRERWQHV